MAHYRTKFALVNALLTLDLDQMRCLTVCRPMCLPSSLSLLGRVLTNPLVRAPLDGISSTCRTLRAALVELMFEHRQAHRAAWSRCVKAGSTTEWLATTTVLAWPLFCRSFVYLSWRLTGSCLRGA